MFASHLFPKRAISRRPQSSQSRKVEHGLLWWHSPYIHGRASLSKDKYKLSTATANNNNNTKSQVFAVYSSQNTLQKRVEEAVMAGTALFKARRTTFHVSNGRWVYHPVLCQTELHIQTNCNSWKLLILAIQKNIFQRCVICRLSK